MVKASPGLVAAILLAVLCLFQNCSETLPDKQMSDSAASVAGPAPAPVPSPAPSALSVTLNSATAGPSAVLPGGAVGLNIRATSNANVSNATLRLSVKNSAGGVVWTRDFPGQSMAANQQKDFNQTFVAPEDFAPGTYAVGVEILSTGGNFVFNASNLANFQISPPIRVAIGRATPYTDILGRVWAADNGISGASTTWTEALLDFQNGTDPELYSSFRFGTNPGEFSFTTPVPSTGKYKVTLKWIEHFVFAPNERLFDVIINGTTVLQNFDLFTAAGGAWRVYDRSFTVTAGSPQVQVTFRAGAIENPKINAIEILGAP